MSVRSLAATAACVVVAGGILGPVAFGGDGHDDELSPAARARYAAEMFRLAGIAATTVACETGSPRVNVDPSLSDPTAARLNSGGPTHLKALAASVDGLFAEFPPLPYAQQRLPGDRVLFTYAVGGKVKIAITVGPNPVEKGYLWLQSAECNPAELPPSTDDFYRVEVWSDAAGKRASTNSVVGYAADKYSAACDGAGVSTLRVDGRGPFVRDPRGTFTGKTHGRYEGSAVRPVDAVDTGYRRAGAALWRADDWTAVYLVRADGVERLPREKGERGHCV